MAYDKLKLSERSHESKGEINMRKAYIVAAKRSAIGSFMGGLTNIPLVDLGATVLKETIKQTKIDPSMRSWSATSLPQDWVRTSAVRSALLPVFR